MARGRRNDDVPTNDGQHELGQQVKKEKAHFKIQLTPLKY